MILARGLLSLLTMARARGAAVCKENAGTLKGSRVSLSLETKHRVSSMLKVV